MDSPGALCWKVMDSVGEYPVSPVNVTVSVRLSPKMMVVSERSVIMDGV